jgi:protein O-mannosyl-transferase
MAVKHKRRGTKASRNPGLIEQSKEAEHKRAIPSQGAEPNFEAAAFSSRRQNIMVCVLLAAAIFSVYFPVLRHPFLNYDDDVYVTSNPYVNTGLKWQNLKWASTALATGNWFPLTWVSHQLDCQIFGLYAGGHHLTNLLLHILNAVLLFWLLERATGARWRSAMVAALFALHPLNVESVAWVAERKNLLCTLFFLLTLAAYGWYVQHPQVKRYLGVAALFVLGLASKPMVITLPFVLLLIDYWPLGRIEGWSSPSAALPAPQQRFSRLQLEKVPLLALSAASAVITLIAQKKAEAVASLEHWTVVWRLENVVHGYAEYLWKTFFPNHLAVLYPALVYRASEIGMALLSLLAVGCLVWRVRSNPPVVMGFLWFLGILVPVIGLVQVGAQSMADRYMYIPCIGIFIAVAWAIGHVGHRAFMDRRWALSAGFVVVAVLALLTTKQLKFWDSSYDLWTHTLQLTVNNFVAEENLASSLVALGRDDEALPHFLAAEQIVPQNVISRMNLGAALLHTGRYSDAIEHFQAIVSLSQDHSLLLGAYQGLGVADAKLGERAQARKYFLEALQIDHSDRISLYNLGLLETEEGIDKLSAAVSAHPTADGYLQLGQFLQSDNRISEALLAYQKALRLDPGLAEAKRALEALNVSR